MTASLLFTNPQPQSPTSEYYPDAQWRITADVRVTDDSGEVLTFETDDLFWLLRCLMRDDTVKDTDVDIAIWRGDIPHVTWQVDGARHLEFTSTSYAALLEQFEADLQHDIRGQSDAQVQAKLQERYCALDCGEALTSIPSIY